MVVVADVLVETLPKPSQRTNKEIESGCVRVDEHLVAVRVRGKTQDVRDWSVCLVFVTHWLSSCWLFHWLSFLGTRVATPRPQVQRLAELA
jgi:hypothetical protein